MASPQLQTGAAPPEEVFRVHDYNEVYSSAQQDGNKLPWDIGAPQPALTSAPLLFHGRVLDVGCGLGQNTLWLASLPAVSSVTGLDFAELAIAQAKSIQATAGDSASKVTFIQADVFNPPFSPSEPFDTLLDCAVFHCIGDDDAQQRYLAAVTPHVRLGGTAVMLAFSDDNPDPWIRPRRISRDHATRMWSAAGWRVDRIDNARYSSNVHSDDNNLAILFQATRIT